jgi:hypothetical protein
MPIPSEVYRALTKKLPATPEAFKLRPARGDKPLEDGLSIAATDAKARGTLTCHGCAVLSVDKILKIPGLTVIPKRPHLQLDPNNPDEELLEVLGLPLATDDPTEIQNYAEAMFRTIVRCV